MFANGGSHEFRVNTEPMAAPLHDADVVSVTIVNYCRQFLPLLRRLHKQVSVDIHDYDGINPYHQEFMSSLKLPGWRSFLEGRIATGTTVAVCTHGSAGASGLTAETGWIDVPAVEVENVVDTNGAGDAFYAGFMTSWLSKGDLESAMRRGAETAAQAVQSPDLAPAQ